MGYVIELFYTPEGCSYRITLLTASHKNIPFEKLLVTEQKDVNVPPNVPLDVPLHVLPSVPLDVPLHVLPSVPLDVPLHVLPNVPLDVPLHVLPSVLLDVPLENF